MFPWSCPAVCSLEPVLRTLKGQHFPHHEFWILTPLTRDWMWIFWKILVWRIFFFSFFFFAGVWGKNTLILSIFLTGEDYKHLGKPRDSQHNSSYQLHLYPQVKGIPSSVLKGNEMSFLTVIEVRSAKSRRQQVCFPPNVSPIPGRWYPSHHDVKAFSPWGTHLSSLPSSSW